MLPELTAMVADGLITTAPMEVVKYAARAVGPFPAHLAVADVMTRDVAAVRPDTPVRELVTLLIDRALRALPVMDEQRPVVGIISDGDVIHRAARRVSAGALQSLLAWFGGGQRPDGLEIAAQGRTAADVMSSPALTIASDTPIAEAVNLMMPQRVKRLPVVDAEGRLIGLVGRAGVLAALSHAEEGAD